MINLSIRNNLAQLREIGPVVIFAAFALGGGWVVRVAAPDNLIAGAVLAAVILSIPLTAITYWLRRRKVSERAQ